MKAKRYLILPVEGIRLSDSATTASSGAAGLLRSLRPQNKAAIASLGNRLAASVLAASPNVAAGPTPTGPAIEVVKSLGEDSVKLVRASSDVLAALRQHNPGIRVIEEQFCTPALAPRITIPTRRAAAPAAKTAAAKKTAASSSVTVKVVRGDNGKAVKGADVIAFRTAQDATQKKTNASGKVVLTFAANAKKLSKLYVYHEEPGVWACYKTNVAVTKGAVTVTLAAIDLAAVDSLRHLHGTGTDTDGQQVIVGIIDSGADANHPDLRNAIVGGANCVPESTRAPNDFGPAGAHGTHVAGTIAATGSAPQGVRGIAPAAKLRIYRVFEDDNESSGSSFAVIDAIERAITDQCDIINLSLGFPPGVSDPAISDALGKARNNGILAVAAAGNDGRQPVSFPGSDSSCVAVSAIGREGLFPDTATEVADVATPSGADPLNFVAAFSNVGADLDAAGSGVGVVSTFPGGYGAMSGTSMASPAVAGVAARLLSANPTILAMPRNAQRTDEIRRLLMSASASLGLGISFEGAGLPK